MTVLESERHWRHIGELRRIPSLAALATMLACSVLHAQSAALFPDAQQPIQSAESILATGAHSALEARMVRIRGVVTLSSGAGLIVQDDTAGIWVNLPKEQQFRAGDYLELSGHVGPGGYSPEIWADSVQIIGKRPLPRPKDVTYLQLSSGYYDAQYVAVTGVVRSYHLPPAGSGASQTWLKLAMKDGIVDVSLPGDVDIPQDGLIDAEVHLCAIALSAKNRNRQLTSVILGVSDIRQLTVLKPPSKDPFARPLVPLGSLLQYRSGTDYYHRVRVEGVVTYCDPGRRLILHDGNAAILVMNPPLLEMRLGDQVEVSGFAAPEDSGPILQDAIMRKIAHGVPPAPVQAHIVDILSGKLRYGLVSLDGTVVRHLERQSDLELLVQIDSSVIPVELQTTQAMAQLKRIEEGTRVRITGINFVDVEGKWDYSPAWVHSRLLLRSTDDIEILRAPSWWTTRHVIYLSTALAALILILLGLVIYNQMARWKLQVVMKERERMAHEIHDTMAQSFAGIGFQLQAILRAIPEGLAELRKEVTHARELVRHSHREARRNIALYEPEVGEEIDLLCSLESCAKKMVANGTIDICATEHGSPRPLPSNMANQLLRIGQEAIANSVRHANPQHLNIIVEHRPDSIQLVLEDDGCGFMKSGNLLGFGLRGMRRRAADISAHLDISSSLGKGSCVSVIAPLERDTLRMILSWMPLFWSRISRTKKLK